MMYKPNMLNNVLNCILLLNYKVTLPKHNICNISFVNTVTLSNRKIDIMNSAQNPSVKISVESSLHCKMIRLCHMIYTYIKPCSKIPETRHSSLVKTIDHLSPAVYHSGSSEW